MAASAADLQIQVSQGHVAPLGHLYQKCLTATVSVEVGRGLWKGGIKGEATEICACHAAKQK